ncbi:permease [Candidatus Marinamargulisbacteria bacterium SCGC AAA071-K20]|nr:permease [Candidatus Marinamargulisbacteria bacterium SCGC AAA071-K20]
MDLIGSLLAIIMGFILGLLGGGGSILTVPILAYFFGFTAVVATGYSLFVVGITSLLGSVKYYKEQLIDFKIAALFSIPSMIGVFISRKYFLPMLPEVMTIGSISLEKNQVIMGLFAMLVLVISGFMFRAKDESSNTSQTKKPLHFRDLLLISVGGFLMACLTGFVGAGGGFIIVPALVLLARLSLRKAIATSLVIISFKSFAGFLGDLLGGLVFDWSFLLNFIMFTMVGVLLGTIFNKRVPVSVLRKGFAYFVFVMGIFIVLKELL